MSRIAVVDVETANADVSSICQIGIVVFENGEVVESIDSLINPQTYFDFFNVSIHGISEEDVIDAPTISDVADTINKCFSSVDMVASYGAFDRTAFERHFGKMPYPWLDIIRVVRRTWSDFAYCGYGLNRVCEYLDIEIIKHHHALSDALSAGLVLIEAQKVSGVDMEEVFQRSFKPINQPIKIKGKGNPAGEYFGEVLVFTGALALPRVEAMQLALNKGFDVNSGVTKKTTYLVKGMQEMHKLGGKELSAKETKALDLVKKGQNIVFLSEKDFFAIVDE